MNKKNAMTLVEIMLVFAIIGIIMTAFVGVVKTRTRDSNLLKIRATMYALQKVSEASMEKLRNEGSWGYAVEENDNNPVCNKACVQWADMVNTKSVDCNEGTFVMTNGVEISGFSGNWENPDLVNGPRHFYKEITFDINGTKSPNTEGVDQFIVRIFKDDPTVVPLTNVLLASTNITKYRTIINREAQRTTYVSVYKVADDTKNGVSFYNALCYAGGRNEFLKTEDINGLGSCTEVCSRYFDCSIQIMDIPSSAANFKGNLN